MRFTLDFGCLLHHQVGPMAALDHTTIKHLNAVLKNKLTGINQYFLHARMLKHQGDMRLADYEYKASIDAMKYSDMLVEHILSLGGTPQLQELGTLMIGEKSRDMLNNDLAHIEVTLVELKAAIAYCESRQDAATVGLLNKIRETQQERITFIERQLAPKAA